MNNLGFSNDSVNIGDFRIKGQNETLIIGNENGGDGYILPTEKGTEGQVITMNADNTTSFQDATGGGGDNVLGAGNGDDISINYSPSGSPVANVIPPSSVGVSRVNIGDIAVGGSVHFYINSRYNLEVPSAGSLDTTTTILFFARGFRADNTLVDASNTGIRNDNYFSGAIAVPADLVGYLKVEAIISRTSTETFKVTLTAFNRRYADSLNPCQIWENLSGVEEFTIPAPQDDDYITWQLQFFNNYYTTGIFNFTNPSVYWTLKNISTAITPPVSTSDHTQLSNLALGDAGHTQFALLGGRSGGQVLSGGITPANFLTLKSHTAGLNNIVVKDLNTSFEKNIDMNNNDIINSNSIQTNQINSVIDLFLSPLNTVVCSSNLNMSTNQIDNVSIVNNGLGPLALIGPSTTSSIVIDPDPANSVVIGGPNDVVVSSNNDVNIISNAGIVNVNSNITNVNVGGTPRLTIDASEVGIGNTLNLNTNDITNGNFINANRIVCGDYETTTGFISFFGLGGIIPSFNSSGLDMNNGVVNSVSSINNITPVGGLYAGTSDGTLITATTTETSILPLSGVGPGLSVPANGFSIGDSFHFVCSGDFSSNNGDTATLRIKANGTNLGVIVVQLTGATNEFYEIEIDFTIRNIGGAGVADIVSNIDFTYSDSGATSWRGSRVVFVNNTTFDTTISNTLELTCQFSSTSVNNSIQTRHATLGKVF